MSPRRFAAKLEKALRSRLTVEVADYNSDALVLKLTIGSRVIEASMLDITPRELNSAQVEESAAELAGKFLPSVEPISSAHEMRLAHAS